MSIILKVESKEFKEKSSHLHNICMIDTRLASELATDGIPDFGDDIHYINIPWSMDVGENHLWLKKTLQAITGYHNIFVLCAYGIRSAYACELLETVETLNIFHIYDGTDGCQLNNIPFKDFDPTQHQIQD